MARAIHGAHSLEAVTVTVHSCRILLRWLGSNIKQGKQHETGHSLQGARCPLRMGGKHFGIPNATSRIPDAALKDSRTNLKKRVVLKLLKDAFS